MQLQDNTYSLNIDELNIHTTEDNIGGAVAEVVRYCFKKLFEMDENIERANRMSFSQINISDDSLSFQQGNEPLQTISRKVKSPEKKPTSALLRKGPVDVSNSRLLQPSMIYRKAKDDAATLKRLPSNIPFFEYLYRQYKHLLNGSNVHNIKNIADATWIQLAALNKMTTDEFKKHVEARDRDLILTLQSQKPGGLTLEEMGKNLAQAGGVMGGFTGEYLEWLRNKLKSGEKTDSGKLKDEMLRNLGDVIDKETAWAHQKTALGKTSIIITIDILKSVGSEKAIGGLEPEAVFFFNQMLQDCEIAKIYVTSMWRIDVGYHGIGQAFDTTLMILNDGTEVWFKMKSPDEIVRPMPDKNKKIVNWLEKYKDIKEVIHAWNRTDHWDHLHFAIEWRKKK